MAKIIEKAKVKEDSGKIRIFSNRRGDIKIKGGIVIKFESINLVDKDEAESLIKTFPGYIKKVD
jgi:hypothetical protein